MDTKIQIIKCGCKIYNSDSDWGKDKIHTYSFCAECKAEYNENLLLLEIKKQKYINKYKKLKTNKIINKYFNIQENIFKLDKKISYYSYCSNKVECLCCNQSIKFCNLDKHKNSKKHINNIPDKNKYEQNTNIIEHNFILKDEDRTYGGNNLFIDLIPYKCWFSNVRTSISKACWDKLRHIIYERANYCCECCLINTLETKINGKLEAHERWDYDEINKIQKLKRIIALCHQCHQTTHYGLAIKNGYKNEAKNHLKKIRNFTDDECDKHIKEAFNLWNERNKTDFKLDLSLITNNGYKIIYNTQTQKNNYKLVNCNTNDLKIIKLNETKKIINKQELNKLLIIYDNNIKLINRKIISIVDGVKTVYLSFICEKSYGRLDILEYCRLISALLYYEGIRGYINIEIKTNLKDEWRSPINEDSLIYNDKNEDKVRIGDMIYLNIYDPKKDEYEISKEYIDKITEFNIIYYEIDIDYTYF